MRLAGCCGPGVFDDLEAELFDDRVSKNFARDAFDFGLRGCAVQAVQREHKELPLTDVAYGCVSEGGQRLLNRGPLRVENGTFEHHPDVSSHGLHYSRRALGQAERRGPGLERGKLSRLFGWRQEGACKSGCGDADDFSRIEVRMKLRPWNQNYVGTQFGGSLYSMCDPFFMLLTMRQVGPGYVVWDKSATIDFLKPGRGTVRAVFEVPRARAEEIRTEADRAGKAHPRFEAMVETLDGEAIARVTKILSVRPARLAGNRQPPAR